MKTFDYYSIVIALNHLTDVVDAASQTNLFKDYVMPVFVVILSAITAYLIAIRGYRFQEASRNERAKADSLNTITLQMQNMQSNLIAIKQNYCEDIEFHPMQRALNVPTMPIRIETVNFKSNELVQLLHASNVDIEKYPWMNMASFVATYSNYNMFIEILNLRNKLDEEVKRQVASLLPSAGPRGEIKTNDIMKLLEESLVMKYVDLTEKLITLVDDLLLTINDFLINFPKKASEPLKKKYLNNYVYLQSYINQSPAYEKSLIRCKEVDIITLARIMKFDEVQARKMYIDSSIVITTPEMK